MSDQEKIEALYQAIVEIGAVLIQISPNRDPVIRTYVQECLRRSDAALFRAFGPRQGR